MKANRKASAHRLKKSDWKPESGLIVDSESEVPLAIHLCHLQRTLDSLPFMYVPLKALSYYSFANL